jgi:hypothetical protein
MECLGVRVSNPRTDAAAGGACVASAGAPHSTVSFKLTKFASSQVGKGWACVALAGAWSSPGS